MKQNHIFLAKWDQFGADGQDYGDQPPLGYTKSDNFWDEPPTNWCRSCTSTARDHEEDSEGKKPFDLRAWFREMLTQDLVLRNLRKDNQPSLRIIWLIPPPTINPISSNPENGRFDPIESVEPQPLDFGRAVAKGWF